MNNTSNRLTRARISERLSAKTMKEWYGRRCDDYDAGCPTCQKWQEYDAIMEQVAYVQELKQRLLGARIKAEELVFQQLKDHHDLVKWANEGDKS